MPPKSDKPLVFISCGQYTDEEIALGKALEQIVKDRTPYDAYFAENQNSLEGLTANIFASLERCMGFIAVAHRRGIVQRPDGDILRASVWVEQEVAIAAFIQHALKRKIEVALYLQKGIRREGVREQLRLAPIEFETSDDVLSDARTRIARWKLEPVRAYSLAAKLRFKTERATGERHDCRLYVDLENNGNVAVTDWRVRLELPRAFAPVGQGQNDPVIIQEDSSTLPSDEAKLYPGDTKKNALLAAYYIDQRNYDGIRPDRPVVTLTVWSHDAKTWSETIPLDKLNEF